MADSHRYAQAVVAGYDTRANLLAPTTYARRAGEIAVETGTAKMWVAKSLSGGDFSRVHGLDMAVVFEGEIITNNEEVVWIE